VKEASRGVAATNHHNIIDGRQRSTVADNPFVKRQTTHGRIHTSAYDTSIPMNQSKRKCIIQRRSIGVSRHQYNNTFHTGWGGNDLHIAALPFFSFAHYFLHALLRLLNIVCSFFKPSTLHVTIASPLVIERVWVNNERLAIQGKR
jgi:hypothetical protein